jgi:hypothetical protein
MHSSNATRKGFQSFTKERKETNDILVSMKKKTARGNVAMELNN